MGSDYSREAIILNISVKGGDYSREAINRGTAIIRGNTVFVNVRVSSESTVSYLIPSRCFSLSNSHSNKLVYFQFNHDIQIWQTIIGTDQGAHFFFIFRFTFSFR